MYNYDYLWRENGYVYLVGTGILMINVLEFTLPIVALNPLYTSGSKMRTSANSEDLDEMQHYAAFHQGLYCLRENIFVWKL